MLFATFISSFVQLGIALLIPAIWWAVTTKRRLEFATWIGLYVPTWKVGPVQRVSQKQLGIALVCWVAVSLASLRIASSVWGALATSRFMGAGLLAVVPILLYAFIQTGLAEELFFRGFLAKRLCASFGFLVERHSSPCLWSSSLTLVHQLSPGIEPCRYHCSYRNQWLDYGVAERTSSGWFGYPQLDAALVGKSPSCSGNGL